MRIVRFVIRGKARYGILEGNIIQGLCGTPFAYAEGDRSSWRFDGKTYSLNEVRLLAPCLPSKIIGLGLNYRSHAEETKLPIPKVPLIFLKPPSAVIGPADTIILPRLCKRVDYEGELGVVIGKKARNVSRTEARKYVLGYTCVNDVSDRYAQKEDGQWTRAKSYDTFAPIGPWIETEVAPHELRLETYLNGQLRQSALTSELIFGVEDLITFISGIMTLEPGDVIATGTPAGIGPMKPGDVVEVRIDKIGILRNFVEAER